MRNNRFDWNEEKNGLNIQKHGISFKEAETVFNDINAIFLLDERHSFDEERFVIIGFSKKPRLLVVCHCYRESDTVIRIISARKANRKETKTYGGAK